MRNDFRTPAGRIEKDDGQPDESTIRKKELTNANTTIDDNMSNDSCIPTLTVRIDKNKQIKFMMTFYQLMTLWSVTHKLVEKYQETSK